MAAVESTMMELKTKAPNFSLPIVTGGFLSLNSYSKNSKGVVITFICNHCPFVKYLNQRLVEVANTYMQRGISFIAISSNDTVNYPQDAPDKMIEVVKEENYPFPYLFDESQEVAKAYQAACTPDFFLYDGDLELVYRGQFDRSRPGNSEKVDGSDLKEAMDALLTSRPNLEHQIPSIGCNIKWKLGNEPNYYG